jgi:acetyltransferase-like isoleucine patch superfamily enzyme
MGDMVAIGLNISFKFARGLLWGLRLSHSSLLLVGRGVAIRNPKYVHADGTLLVEDFAEIQGLSIRGISFGNKVTVGRHAMIRPSGYYGREIGEGLRVGTNSSIGVSSFIGCGGFVDIGSRVMMGPNVSIIAESHLFETIDTPMKAQGIARSGVVVGDDCWLGAGSIILDGVSVGHGSIVAAGAVVTKSFPPYSVLAGVPAVLIRSRVDPK